MKRNVGDVYVYSNRNIIKTDDGVEFFARYVARNNPEICGKWFDGCEVHHLDGNTLNDDPYNLIVLTSEIHHKIHSKSVVAFLDNEYLGKYGSLSDCAASLQIPISTISYFCKHNKPISSTYKNYRFAYSF